MKFAAVNKPNPADLTTLLTATLNGNTPGTAIGDALVGQRFQYTIEALWKDANGNYELTPSVQTNFVTYLQPVDFQVENFDLTDPHHVKLTIPATCGADDYLLQVSPDTTFDVLKTYTPYNTSLILPQSATQANPREGTAFAFADPSVGLDLAGDFSGSTEVFARIGVRDSRNGASTTANPYLFSNIAELTL